MRSHFSRESSHQSHDGRLRFSESPKKTSSTKRTSEEMNEAGEKDDEEKEEKEEESYDTTKECLQRTSSSMEKETSEARAENEGKIGTGLEIETHAAIQMSAMEQQSNEAGEEDQRPEKSTSLDMTSHDNREIQTKAEILAQADALSTIDRQEASRDSDQMKLSGNSETLGFAQANVATMKEGLLVGKPTTDASAVLGEGDTTLPQKLSKDPAHRLSLPLNELIRLVELIVAFSVASECLGTPLLQG